MSSRDRRSCARRSVLRGAGATVGVATAGCLGAVASSRDPGADRDREVGPDAVPDGGTLTGARNVTTFVEVAALLPADGPLPTGVRNDLVDDYRRIYGPCGVVPGDVDAVVAGSDFRMSMGDIDADAVESALTDREYVVADHYRGYTILSDDARDGTRRDDRGRSGIHITTPASAVAVRDGELIRCCSRHGVDGVVPIVDALEGEPPRHRDAIEGMDRVLDELGDGPVVRVHRSEESLKEPPEGPLAGGTAREIGPGTTTDRTAHVFDDEASVANAGTGVDAAALEEWFEDGDELAAADRVDVEVTGRVAVATVERRTADVDRLFPPVIR